MMKSKLYRVVISFILLGLAACQSAPATPIAQTPTPAASTTAEFFKDEVGRWLSIEIPAGWVAELAGSDATPMIVVTDNWEKYQNKALDQEAIGIIVLPLSDKGTAAQV